MTELSFSKSFLSTLAARPQRLPLDYCEDPRKLPARTPYTLPRHLPARTPRSSLPAADTPAATSVNITLKPLRPVPDITAQILPSTPLTATALSLKAAFSRATSTKPEKLKILYKGKPVSDVTTLKELGLEGGESEVVLSVMVMPGAKIEKPVEEEKKVEEKAPEVEMKDVEEGPRKVLETEAFWTDLKAFLNTRLVGGEELEEVVKVFREAWAKRS